MKVTVKLVMKTNSQNRSPAGNRRPVDRADLSLGPINGGRRPVNCTMEKGTSMVVAVKYQVTTRRYSREGEPWQPLGLLQSTENLHLHLQS